MFVFESVLALGASKKCLPLVTAESNTYDTHVICMRPAVTHVTFHRSQAGCALHLCCTNMRQTQSKARGKDIARALIKKQFDKEVWRGIRENASGHATALRHKRANMKPHFLHNLPIGSFVRFEVHVARHAASVAGGRGAGWACIKRRHAIAEGV